MGASKVAYNLDPKSPARLSCSARDCFMPYDPAGETDAAFAEWFSCVAHRHGLVEGVHFEKRGADFAISVETQCELVLETLQTTQDRYRQLRLQGRIDPIDFFEEDGE